MSEWIKVSDRMPEIDVPVLCVFEHWKAKISRVDVFVAVDESDCNWRVWDLGYMDELSHDYNITHWMPLPRVPQCFEGGSEKTCSCPDCGPCLTQVGE